jgi:hypothetical protein
MASPLGILQCHLPSFASVYRLANFATLMAESIGSLN